jgi:hydroxypyruvate isomerase
MRVDAVVPAVYDCGLEEGVRRAAEAGVDGFEFFDLDADLDSLVETAEEAGVEIAGTLAAGAGANIGDPDGDAVSYPDSHDTAVADLERSLEVAADIGAHGLVSTVGQSVDTVADDAQHRAVVSVLRAVAPLAEELGVTVVVEPLNRRVDHPGYYLDSSYEAYEIVDAVDSPAVKVLYDVYHQQITEGDVIRNIRNHAEAIGHVHIADNPGRHEPGTGELNYANVFEAIEGSAYDGFVGCEFSPTGDPDEALEDVVELAEAAE